MSCRDSRARRYSPKISGYFCDNDILDNTSTTCQTLSNALLSQCSLSAWFRTHKSSHHGTFGSSRTCTKMYCNKKKQSIITLRHEGQLIRTITKTLNVSSNAGTKAINNAMMKPALMRTAPGKEDCDLPLLQRISSSL